MNITLDTKALQRCEPVSGHKVPEHVRQHFDWVEDDCGFFKLGECWHHIEEFALSSGELQWFSTSVSTGVARLPSYDDDSFFAFNFSD